MVFPFEVPFEQLQAEIDTYVDVVCGSLQSEFLTLPMGEGFVEYPVFEKGYESLKLATNGFHDFTPDRVLEAILQTPISLIVLRTMLGFTPPEWAYITTQRSTVAVPQGAVRSLDRKIRQQPMIPWRENGRLTRSRIRALVQTACQLLSEGAPQGLPGVLHRLDKADTRHGLSSLQPLANLGVPYAMLAIRTVSGETLCRPQGFGQRVNRKCSGDCHRGHSYPGGDQFP